MMRKFIFIIFILFVSCVNKTNERTVVSFSSNEIDVINVIIKTLNQENKVLVINKNLEITYTTQDNNRNNIYKYLKRTKKVYNDLLNSFKKNNDRQMVLEEDIIFAFDYIWGEPYKLNDPINFYGIITFSKIGFNKEQTKAIIYIGRLMKGEGRGDYYIVEKENEEWKIKNIIVGWIT
jgi:hypothetical protein